MKNISLYIKMFLSMLTFSVPICVLAYLMYSSQSIHINFVKQELKGIEYQKPLQDFFRVVSLHRILSSFSAVDGAIQMKDLINEGDEIIQKLRIVDKQYGEDLEFTDLGLKKRQRESFNVLTLENLWDELKKNSSDDKHIKIISHVRTMITHMGDTSNLILDPDLDSYYLMDIVLLALPQMQDRIQEIAITAHLNLNKSQLDFSDRLSLGLFAKLLNDSDLTRIQSAVQTSLNEDAHFYSVSPSLQNKLPNSLAQFEKVSVSLRDILSQSSERGISSVPLDLFQQVSISALQQSFTFWNLSSQELKTLLNIRLHTLENERLLSLLVSLFVLIMACTFSYFITTSVTKSVSNVANQLLLAEGRVEQSSRKLSQASLDLSGSTTEAASSLQESVASIEELSSMVSQNAKNTKNVSLFSEQADAYAESASKQVKSLIQCMDKITRGSKEIEDIISVIDDIAFQTNLLALNAAVEAARAGEQGRGFAVVAESVRSLALKSSDSAKQISELIKSNGESVNVGNSMAIQSGESIESIVKVIKNVTNLNKEIATASDEQSIGLNQITTALNSLDAATQKNATASGEVAEFADFLYKESAILGQHVATLKLIVEGKKD